MNCKRCPHHVRHGYANTAGKVVFENLCGLKVKKFERIELEKQVAKKQTPQEKKQQLQGATRGPANRYCKEHVCEKYPFPEAFEYMLCDVYYDTFKSINEKKDAVPTKDFQYSDAFTAMSITEMELL